MGSLLLRFLCGLCLSEQSGQGPLSNTCFTGISKSHKGSSHTRALTRDKGSPADSGDGKVGESCGWHFQAKGTLNNHLSSSSHLCHLAVCVPGQTMRVVPVSVLHGPLTGRRFNSTERGGSSGNRCPENPVITSLAD